MSSKQGSNWDKVCRIKKEHQRTYKEAYFNASSREARICVAQRYVIRLGINRIEKGVNAHAQVV